MAQRTRMFKAFVALVASMLGGALLLASIEPGITLSSIQPAILLHAHASVSSPIDHPWDAIQVLCVPLSGHNSLANNGIRPSRRAHLVIDAQGLLRVNSAWWNRQQLSGLEGAVVICVQVGPAFRQLNQIQLETLDMLLPRLCHQLNLPAIQVRFASIHPGISDLGQMRNRLEQLTSMGQP